MAFGWEDYLSLANDLSKDQNNEAALRSAVSRAYYAAFNIAKDFLNKNGAEISESTPSVHHKVWNEFRRRGRTGLTVYTNGDRLKKRRGDADYDLEPKNLNGKLKDWSKEVEQSRREADQVLHWVRQIAGSK
jgi:uncharacterized protein (UPF0332 family)